MELIIENIAIEESIKSLGFDSTQDYLNQKIQIDLNNKISYYQSRIDFFEKKYQTNYRNFCDQFDLLQGSILDKEDDSQDWEFSIEGKEIYAQKLQKFL